MQRIEKEGVLGATYDEATSTLCVEFMRGVRYHYFDVPRSVYTWLCRTAEPGGYVRRILTPRYRYRALPSVGKVIEQDLVRALEASLARLTPSTASNED
jgi:KTSC domain